MPVKPWWRLATPHKDVKDGKLDEGVFSADSAKVSHPEVNKEILSTEWMTLRQAIRWVFKGTGCTAKSGYNRSSLK